MLAFCQTLCILCLQRNLRILFSSRHIILRINLFLVDENLFEILCFKICGEGKLLALHT